MKLSIIIITWNDCERTRQCLNELYKLLNDREYIEIIVVDNGSIDKTHKTIKKDFPKVAYRKLSKNFGVAYARNRGIEQSKGKYILILDNDTIPNLSAIRGMEKFMDENPKCGLCSCALTDINNICQPNCKRYPGILAKARNIIHRGSYIYEYPNFMESCFEPEYLIGACQFIRRKAYQETGPLDEKIFYGPEDADFCIRLRKKNWQLSFLPQYSIKHHCVRATNKKLFSKLALKHIKGLIYFYWKHKRLN